MEMEPVNEVARRFRKELSQIPALDPESPPRVTAVCMIAVVEVDEGRYWLEYAAGTTADAFENADEWQVRGLLKELEHHLDMQNVDRALRGYLDEDDDEEDEEE